MSDDGTGADLGERVDRLEAGQETMAAKLDQILGLVRGGGRGASGPEGEAGPASRPMTTGEQVRAELAAARAEEAEAQAAEAEKSELEEIKGLAAKLREVPPVPPQRRSERAVWGPR